MHENNESAYTIAAALNADGRRTVCGRRWPSHNVTQTLARGDWDVLADRTDGQRHADR